MSNLLRGRAWVAAVLAAVVVAGCGGPPRAQVRGKVTVDGKPLASGSIEFFPADGKGQTAGVAILNGEYQVETSPGEVKVSINGSEVVGKQKAYNTPDSPMIDIVRNAVPARYNAQSELRKTLNEGPNEVNFDLTGDAKKK